MPDIQALKRLLWGQQIPPRVVPFEISVSTRVKSAFLASSIDTSMREVEFWRWAGYDCVPVRMGLFSDPVRGWWAEHGGKVTGRLQLCGVSWPEGDLGASQLVRLQDVLPENMGVMVCLGKVFTSVWMLMGFETFAVALYEDAGLVRDLFQRVGDIQFRTLCTAVEDLGADVVVMPDDIACAEGLLVGPDYLRELVFPWYRAMGEVCQRAGRPYIYHSDGRLYQVMEDIIACGFCAIHPIEPKGMGLADLKRRCGGRLCLLGGVDLDLLARATPDQIAAVTRQTIAVGGRGGGYAPGSSNSVTGYVPYENYRAMLDTIHCYGPYPQEE